MLQGQGGAIAGSELSLHVQAIPGASPRTQKALMVPLRQTKPLDLPLFPYGVSVSSWRRL